MNRESLNSMLRTIKSYLYIPITVLLAFFVFKVLLLPGIVPTASMEPTIRAGSFYMASRVTYAIQGPQRGNIVLFRDRTEGNNIGYIKRIIGMPGDSILISQGKVYVNGAELDESEYLPDGIYTEAGNLEEYQVPEGYYFVLGDNREDSNDSRYMKYPFIAEKDMYAYPLFYVHIPGWV